MFILFLLILPLISGQKIVETSYGRLEGSTIVSADGNQKHVFKSVPFAKPPIGELRFKLPEKPDKWQGVLNASTYSAACLSDSYKGSSPQKFISEDCLYINIFTSDYCLKNKCPVIIYYHGGAFNLDSATMFPDDFIIERYVSEGVVFVIPASRLGVFGLLDFGDETVVHENLVAYDAEAALHYVHDEISNFGGDTGKVTLMGHSSGGTLVLTFGFSRLIDPNRELFQQFIALSPIPIFNDRNLLVNNSYELATRLNCYDARKGQSPSEIVDCLRKLESKDVLATQKSLEIEKLNFRNLIRGGPFMKYNEKIAEFKENVIPRRMLIGCTSSEFAKAFSRNPARYGSFLDFENPIEIEGLFEKLLPEHEDWVNSDSAAVFVSTATYSEAMASNGGRVYLFESREKPSNNHVSDMQYFIGVHREKTHTDDMDILDSFYSQLLVNFTKFGEPSPYWDPLDPLRMNFLALEVDTKLKIGPVMEENFHEDDVKLWTVNFTGVDKMITQQKINAADDSINVEISPIKNALQNNLDDAENYSIFRQWWLYLIVLFVVFSIGIVFFAFFRKRNVEETQPLLYR